MANEYETSLVCKSNNQLLQKIDPRDIIKTPNNKFISCKKGIYYFTSRGGTMHESIIELSKVYPTEVFIAKYRDGDIYYDSEIQTIKYKSGKSKCTKIEPDYWYNISHIEKIVGKEPLERLMKVVLRHIKRIDAMSDTLKAQNADERERQLNIKSSVAINVETDKIKIEATKIGSSFIEVNAFIKEAPAPKWQLIGKEKNRVVRVAYPLDKSDDEAKEEEYEDVPF